MSSVNISSISDARRLPSHRAAARRSCFVPAHPATSQSSENDSSWDIGKPSISKGIDGKHINQSERGQRLPLADPRKHANKLKRSYVQVENDKRQLLVKLVNQNQCTIKAAAKQLGINYSTAKHIFKQHTLAQGEFQHMPPAVQNFKF